MKGKLLNIFKQTGLGLIFILMFYTLVIILIGLFAILIHYPILLFTFAMLSILGLAYIIGESFVDKKIQKKE